MKHLFLYTMLAEGRETGQGVFHWGGNLCMYNAFTFNWVKFSSALRRCPGPWCPSRYAIPYVHSILPLSNHGCENHRQPQPGEVPPLSTNFTWARCFHIFVTLKKSATFYPTENGGLEHERFDLYIFRDSSCLWHISAHRYFLDNALSEQAW